MNGFGRIPPLIFSAWLALACAQAAPPPPGEPEGSPAYELSGIVTSEDFDYADRIGEFVLEGAEDLDAPELGFRLRYRSREIPDLVADAFVYPIALPELASLSHVLEIENTNLEAEIGLVWETRGHRAGVVSTQAYAPRDGGILLPGLLGYREISGSGLSLRSYSFLTINENLFFKLRMTLEDSEATRERDPFRPFLEQLSQTLKARNTPRRELQIVVTARAIDVASDGRSCVLSAWLGYAARMGHLIQQGQYLDTYERESEARQVALDVWEELSAQPEKDCESPAFLALSSARDAALLPEYIWQTYRRSYWVSPRLLDIERFERWADTELPDHDPMRFPGILVRWKN